MKGALFLSFIFCYFNSFAQNIDRLEIDQQQLPNHKYQAISRKNKQPVNTFIWDTIMPFVNSFAIAKKDGKVTLLNKKGDPVNGNRYDSARYFVNDMAAVFLNKKWGFIDKKGREVIPIEYTNVFDFNEEEAVVCKNDVWFVIDKDGHYLRELVKNSRNSYSETLVSGLKQKPVRSPLSIQARTAFTSNMPCPPNIDFEYGNFNGWETNIGTVSSPAYSAIINLPATTWLAGTNTRGRQEIQDRNGNFPSKDFYGGFPVNPANGGRYAVKLGSDADLGICGSGPCPDRRSESIRYIVNVPNQSADYSITFSYAVVLENPNDPSNLHEDYQQPRFLVRMYDPSPGGDTISCANFTFVASGPLPGFDTSVYTKHSDAIVKYKDWSSVYVNLSKYGGKTLYLEFTTADCTLGGHFGYAYVDVAECGISATSQYQCSSKVATLTGPPGFANYKWFDDGYSKLVGTGQTVMINNATLGSKYWVVVTPYANTGCPTCDCRDTIGVKVSATYPTADAGSDKAICPGTSIPIGTVSGSGYSYSWSPITGLSDSHLASPVANPSKDTKYALTVTDNATGCAATDSVSLFVMPKPSPSFIINKLNQCISGNDYLFTNTSVTLGSTVTYKWDFGDGASSNSTNASHSYTVAGNYLVKLLAITVSGCRDSISKEVTVYPAPDVTFTINAASQCNRGNNFVFSSTGFGISSCDWNIPGLFSSTRKTATYSFSDPGDYTIKLIAVSKDGCKDSSTAQVVVYPQPVSDFEINTPRQCSNTNNYTFKNISSIATGVLNYRWDLGDSSGSSSVKSLAYTYASPGVYTVRLVATSNYGCADSIKKVITVYPNASINYTINADNQCLPGNQFNFSNNSAVVTGNISYRWNFGDGATSSQSNPTHVYNSEGNFTVSLLGITNNGCRDSVSRNVTVLAIPQVILSATDIAICDRDSALITANATAGSGSITGYEWYQNGTLVSSTNQRSLLVSQPGSYVVKVTNSNGCVNRSSASVVTIRPLPSGSISRSSSYIICEGSSITLTAGGGYTYQWKYNNSSIAGAVTNSIVATKAGTYSVRLISQDGCSAMSTNNTVLNFIAKPSADFSFEDYCVDLPVAFTNRSSTLNSGPVGWYWSFGDASTSTVFNPQHTYTKSGNYSVLLKVTSSVCPELSDSMQKVIGVEIPPNGTRYPTVNAVINQPKQLEARPLGSFYAWRPALGLSNPATINPFFIGNKDQEYNIKIRLFSGCSVTDTVLVRAFKAADIFVPRAWSPNNDGHNDYLYPILVGSMRLKVFRIFDRWGQLMFETINAKEGWNGVFNKVPQPSETYTWNVQAIDSAGNLINRSGNSVLIR